MATATHQQNGHDCGSANGKPGCPETRNCRPDRQIEVPHMVGALGSNHATGHHLLLLCDRMRRFPQHPSYSCRAQVQTRTRERLRDLHLAHGGTKGLQSLHRVAHEVREPIDRLAKLQERFWTLLVDPLCSGRKCCWREQKSIGNLLERPAASGSNFENRQSLRGSVARPSGRCND